MFGSRKTYAQAHWPLPLLAASLLLAPTLALAQPRGANAWPPAAPSTLQAGPPGPGRAESRPAEGPRQAPPDMFIDAPDVAPRAAAVAQTPPGAPPLGAPGRLANAAGNVRIEQQNRTVAVGTVLNGDGRILTALRLDGPDKLTSPDVTVIYDDNTRAPGRIMHHDRQAGLALVIPLEGRRKQGMTASEADPLGAPMRLVDGKREVRITLRAPTPSEVASAGSDGWATGLYIGDNGDNAQAGSPIVDDAGFVAAIRTTRCALVANPKAAGGLENRCTFPAMASVAAIRGFLSRTPATAVQPAPWLGIRGQANDGAVVRGVRVLAIAPKSPAATAGLHADADPAKADVIATIDGIAVDTPEALSEVIAKHSPGERVKAVVFNGVKSRELTIALHAAP